MPSTPNPPRGQFDFSAGEVEAALKSFPVWSSAGPSGLRPCHLLEMARGDDGSRLLEALASFCSALANNSLSCDCMKLLTTARLVAVAKPNGGVRPIAVGETLRRLAAKCVHEATLSAVSSYLLPTQVGVKVPNAAELVAHKVKAWRQENRQDEIIVQVDLRNAFNSIDRNVLLREVRERVPALYPYAHACYSTPAFFFLVMASKFKARAVFNKETCADLHCSQLQYRKPSWSSPNSTSPSNTGIWTMVSSADQQATLLVQWHTLKLNFPLLGCSSTAKSAEFFATKALYFRMTCSNCLVCRSLPAPLFLAFLLVVTSLFSSSATTPYRSWRICCRRSPGWDPALGSSSSSELALEPAALITSCAHLISCTAAVLPTTQLFLSAKPWTTCCVPRRPTSNSPWHAWLPVVVVLA